MTTKQVQLLLAFLGYDPGALDGLLGTQTRNAVRQFQREYGLTVDGDPGTQTQKGLREAVAGTMDKLPNSEPEAAETSGRDQTQQKTFWDEIEFFAAEEFKCKCGGRYCNGYPAQMQEAVVRIADAARRHFGRPGHVSSGLRCARWNALQNGVENSQHMFGEAVDLAIEGVGSEALDYGSGLIVAGCFTRATSQPPALWRATPGGRGWRKNAWFWCSC